MSNQTKDQDSLNIDYNFSRNEISVLDRFMWKCAGADVQILEQCPKADHVKYFCIGGFVFFTGLLAALSFYFAMETVFGKWYISIPLGIIWGYMIFNIDRFIISSTGKGDGTDKITWDEFKNAIPRIIMAAIFGIVISAPLEVKIFEKEISDIMAKEEEERKKEASEVMKKTPEYSKAQQEFDDINTKIKSKEALIEAQNQQITAETRTVYCGPKCDALKAQNDLFRKELEILKAEKEKLSAERDKVIALKDKDAALQVKSLKENTGLARRIHIVHDEFPKICLMISLVFLLVECGPIFFKMMVNRSPYDYIEEDYKKIIVAKKGIIEHAELITEKIDGGNNSISVHYDRHLHKEAKLIEVMDQIEKQRQANILYLNNVYQAEIKKIQDQFKS
jgi:hypothetical protein